MDMVGLVSEVIGGLKGGNLVINHFTVFLKCKVKNIQKGR